jgi:hypothetical protein
MTVEYFRKKMTKACGVVCHRSDGHSIEVAKVLSRVLRRVTLRMVVDQCGCMVIGTLTKN